MIHQKPHSPHASGVLRLGWKALEDEQVPKTWFTLPMTMMDFQEKQNSQGHAKLPIFLKPSKVTPAVDCNFCLDIFPTPGRPCLPPFFPASWEAFAAPRHSSHCKGSAQSLRSPTGLQATHCWTLPSCHHSNVQSKWLSRLTTRTLFLALLSISAYLTNLNSALSTAEFSLA